MRAAILLLALLLTPPPAAADTIYVETKAFSWEWGPGPGHDPELGLGPLREWLELKAAPKLQPAPAGITQALRRKLELEGIREIEGAVAGPPRSKNGRPAILYYWVEWVSRSKSPLDQGAKRVRRESGLAKLEIVGFGEEKFELLKFYPEEELKEVELGKIVPWDAAVVTRKLFEARRKVRRDRSTAIMSR